MTPDRLSPEDIEVVCSVCEESWPTARLEDHSELCAVLQQVRYKTLHLHSLATAAHCTAGSLCHLRSVRTVQAYALTYTRARVCVCVCVQLTQTGLSVDAMLTTLANVIEEQVRDDPYHNYKPLVTHLGSNQ